MFEMEHNGNLIFSYKLGPDGLLSDFSGAAGRYYEQARKYGEEDYFFKYSCNRNGFAFVNHNTTNLSMPTAFLT